MRVHLFSLSVSYTHMHTDGMLLSWKMSAGFILTFTDSSLGLPVHHTTQSQALFLCVSPLMKDYISVFLLRVPLQILINTPDTTTTTHKAQMGEKMESSIFILSAKSGLWLVSAAATCPDYMITFDYVVIVMMMRDAFLNVDSENSLLLSMLFNRERILQHLTRFFAFHLQ